MSDDNILFQDDSEDESLNASKFFFVEGEYDKLKEDSQLLSANDYLLSVRHENKKLPATVIKKIKNITPKKFGLTHSMASLIIHKDEVDYEKNAVFLEKNNDLIKEFQELRETIGKIKSEKLSNIYKFPDINDEQCWFSFCLGKFYANGVIDGSHCEPLLSIVCELSQNQVIKLIGYLANCNIPFTHIMGRWIYALLTVIFIPLDNDVVYSLRSIARNMMHLIKN